MPRYHDEEEWMRVFTERGAFWLHDENPKRPHALLTSGMHSNGFFNGSKVIEDPEVLGKAMHDLFQKIEQEGGELPRTVGDRLKRDVVVIGSALGACDLSYELGRILQCKRGFTEPVEEDGKKTMVLKRFEIPADKHVLVVEDVFTTGGTTEQTIASIEKKGATVWPILGVLVNRSGKSNLGDRKVAAVIDRPMPMWAPEECPLCQAGSEAIRPKGNWDRLTAQY